MKENSFFKMIRELKDFLLLWASQAVSELGTAMTNYALTISGSTSKRVRRPA